MTETEYRKVRRGARVRSLRVLSNRLGSVPAGTMFTVDAKHGGFSLDADPCDCCGFALTISKVQREAVELVGDPDPNDLTGKNGSPQPRRSYEL